MPTPFFLIPIAPGSRELKMKRARFRDADKDSQSTLAQFRPISKTTTGGNKSHGPVSSFPFLPKYSLISKNCTFSKYFHPSPSVPSRPQPTTRHYCIKNLSFTFRIPTFTFKDLGKRIPTRFPTLNPK